MAGEGRRVALVTGAGGGLGGALARALAARGFDLVLNDLGESAALSELADELRRSGAKAAIVTQDIARIEQAPDFVGRAFAAFGRLDCLVNNAGVSVLSRGDPLDVTPESFDRCVAVNLRAQFFLTQAVARRMIDAGRPAQGSPRRSIIFITTVAIDSVVARVLVEYSTSKAALSHAVRHFAVRLVGEGIDCWEIRPGMMATAMTSTSKEKYDAMIAQGQVPAGRWGEIAEVGRAAATLASGEIGYCVGQAITLDGGLALKSF